VFLFSKSSGFRNSFFWPWMMFETGDFGDCILKQGCIQYWDILGSDVTLNLIATRRAAEGYKQSRRKSSSTFWPMFTKVINRWAEPFIATVALDGECVTAAWSPSESGEYLAERSK